MRENIILPSVLVANVRLLNGKIDELFVSLVLRIQSLPNSRNSNDSLNEDIQHYINLSLASTTQQTYSSGEKRFITFIRLYKRKHIEQCLPADELLLTEFVALISCKIYQIFCYKNILSSSPSLPYSAWFPVKFAQNVTLATCVESN